MIAHSWDGSLVARWFTASNKGIVLERENSGTCRIDCPNSVILESNAPIPSLCEIKPSTLIFSSWEMSRAPEHETILSSGHRAYGEGEQVQLLDIVIHQRYRRTNRNFGIVMVPCG